MNRWFLVLCILLALSATTVAQDGSDTTIEFERISVDNVHEIRQVNARYGGWLSKVVWLSDTTLAIDGIAGISLYDTTTPDIPPQPILALPPGYSAIAFHPSSASLAFIVGDIETLGETRAGLWNIVTGEQLYSLEGVGRILVPSPDGSLLVTDGRRGRGETIIWDAATGERITLFHCETLRSAAFNPDGSLLAIAGNSGYIVIYEVKQLLKGDTNHCEGENTIPAYVAARDIEFNPVKIAFSPDGDSIAVTDVRYIRLFDPHTGEEQQALRHNHSRLYTFAFSPDGTMLASGGYGRLVVSVWDLQTGEVIHDLRGHEDWVVSVAFSPDGTRLASVSGNQWESRDSSMRIWDVATGTEIAVFRLPGHIDEIHRIDFSPDGQLLASSDTFQGAAFRLEGAIHIWSTPDLTEIVTLPESFQGFVSDTSLSYCTENREQYIYDLEMATVTATTPTGWCGLLSPDGRLAATGEGGYFYLHLRDPSNGEVLASSTVPAIWRAFNADGTMLATSSIFSHIAIWDVEQLIQKGEFAVEDAVAVMPNQGVENGPGGDVAFSPDDAYLVYSSFDGIFIWDINRQHVVAELGDNLRANNMTFSPDGQLLVTGVRGYDVVRIWDTSTWEQIGFIPGLYASSVAFSPDGTLIATGGGDAAIRLWGVPSTDT